MPDPISQVNGNTDYTNIHQPNGQRQIEEDEELFQFSDNDRKITREVDGSPREIRIGHDREGNKFRYTDDTHDILVTATTEGKNTYLTKAEFDRQVREILHVNELPEGIRAELRDGSIVFIDKETNLTMTAAQLRQDERILAAQQQRSPQINPLDLIGQNPVSITSTLNQPNFNADIKLDIQPVTTEFNREALLASIKENPNQFLPILSELYGDSRQGQAALLRLVRDNFDISQPSGATAEDINQRLAEVKSPLRNMGQLFLDAEQKYGVNAWAILGVIGIESSYGKNRAQGTQGNFIGLKHRNSNQHRELQGATRQETYRNNINAVAHQLHLYNTRGLTSPYQVATRYCDANKGPWSNFMATEILRGQTANAPKPDGNLMAQLRGEQPMTQPTTASVTPPATDDSSMEFTLDEIVVTGSLSRVKKQTPISQVNPENPNGTEG